MRKFKQFGLSHSRKLYVGIPQPITPLRPGAKTKVRVIMGSALLFLLGSPLSPCGAKVVGSWPAEEAEAEVSGGGGNPSSLPSCAHLHMRIRESVEVPTRLEIAKCRS